MAKVKNIKLKMYIIVVMLCGLMVSVYVLHNYWQGISILGIIIFGILIFLADNLSAPLPKTGSVSVSFGVALASLILYGPSTALIVTVISIFNIKEIIKRVSIQKHLFNAGQYLISVGIAGIVFEQLYSRNIKSIFDLRNIGIIFLTAYIFFMLNTMLTAGVIALSNKINVVNVWIFNFAWLVPFQAFLTAMAIAISFLYKLYGAFTLIFTSLPLIIAQYTYLLRIKERKVILKSIMQIVKTMEAKDVYTAGHSIRVAEYCEKIARDLRLNEYDIEILKNLANLHDVGKIQIDLSVLNKKTKLGKKDWSEIKKHPVTSYEIVKEIDFLKGKAGAVLDHHERIDGKGYPNGKKGSEVSLFAKIISVADSYDAMTTDRPYRKALSKKESLIEIRENIGTQFDEKVAKCMIKILKAELEQI